jgi:hypothetical protein
MNAQSPNDETPSNHYDYKAPAFSIRASLAYAEVAGFGDRTLKNT